MDYQTFLENKKHSAMNYGIECNYLHDAMFDFQKYVSEYAIKKGRCAIFLDTGLGKTIIELVVAKNFIHHLNKPVLIITPLAVAFQFLKEAQKFNIDDIEYSRDGKYKSKIVIANYERLHYFNSSDYDCVILDESSILKNFDGATKNHITNFLKKVKYRFLFTATPSPNDFIELGTSSEALGYLGYTDMLTRFFTNNEDTISPMNIGTEWILKGHAKENFFKWVSGWSISMRKPSDLGFDDSKHILPKLITNYHSVKNEKNMVINGQILMFNQVAKTNPEILTERKQTIEKRCEIAAKLAMQHDCSMLWCNLNPEGDLLEKLIPFSVQISGQDSIEKKEEAIEWFVGEKCICNSINFKNKFTKCGNQNMQPQGAKNIIPIQKKEKKENHKGEHLNRIKNTWQDITNQSLKDLKKQKSNNQNIIQQEEQDMPLMNYTENPLKQNQLNGGKIIQTKDLNEPLGNTGLEQKISMSCLQSKMEAVQYVGQEFQEIKEDIDYTLTIAIQQEKSGGCFVVPAISELGNSETIQNYSIRQQCTCGHNSGVRRLISKTKIFGFGLNLQHCNHTVYFPTFSYEQYYQAIRRFWRFGQKRNVVCDLVFSDGQKRVLDSLLAKTEKANQLFDKLNSNLHTNFDTKSKEFNKEILLPSFI